MCECVKNVPVKWHCLCVHVWLHMDWHKGNQMNVRFSLCVHSLPAQLLPEREVLWKKGGETDREKERNRERGEKMGKKREKKDLHKWESEWQEGSAPLCLMTVPVTHAELFKYDSPVSTIIIFLAFTLHTQQPANWHIITHLLIVSPCR